jgi:hypothetical protein
MSEARMVVECGGCNRILTIPVAWGVSLFRGARSPGCGPRHMSRLGVLVTRRFVEHVHRSDRVDALVDDEGGMIARVCVHGNIVTGNASNTDGTSTMLWRAAA